MVKRGNDNAQMKREEYEAMRDEKGRRVTVGINRADADAMKRRRIVQTSRPSPSTATTSPSSASSNPFKNIQLKVDAKVPPLNFAPVPAPAFGSTPAFASPAPAASVSAPAAPTSSQLSEKDQSTIKYLQNDIKKLLVEYKKRIGQENLVQSTTRAFLLQINTKHAKICELQYKAKNTAAKVATASAVPARVTLVPAPAAPPAIQAPEPVAKKPAFAAISPKKAPMSSSSSSSFTTAAKPAFAAPTPADVVMPDEPATVVGAAPDDGTGFQTVLTMNFPVCLFYNDDDGKAVKAVASKVPLLIQQYESKLRLLIREEASGAILYNCLLQNPKFLDIGPNKKGQHVAKVTFLGQNVGAPKPKFLFIYGPKDLVEPLKKLI